MKRSRGPLSPAVAATILAGGGAALLLVERWLRSFQSSKVLSPEAEPLDSWDPVRYGIPEGRAVDVWFDAADGETLHGWYCRAELPRASILFCHGSAGNLTTMAHVVPHLLAAGCNVLIFDYRGFGRSGGRPSLRGVVDDALTAARFHDEIRPAHLPSILHGFSLGGAVALQILPKHPFDALILQSTFTSLRDIARIVHPHVPLHMLAGGLFDNLAAVRRLRIPLLVIHGTEDELVPCSMAHALFDACPTARQLRIVEGGMHKDVFAHDGDALVWSIAELAESAVIGSAPPQPLRGDTLSHAPFHRPASHQRL